MPNFVWDNSSLPADKANLISLPSGANPVNYVAGTDLNAIFSALREIRSAVFKGGGKATPSTAPPVSGSYIEGDVVFNSAPAVAAPIGWVCTVAGSPGTWKEFGVIADDVVNGGSSGGTAGPSDVATPGRSFAAGVGGSAVYEFWPDGVASVRRAVIGFLASADPDLTLQNEKTNGKVKIIANGTGTIDLQSETKVNKISPFTGSVVEVAAPKLKVTGTNSATVDLYPDGTTTRMGAVGFDVATDTVLKIKNEKGSNAHVRVEPGSGGSIQLGAAEATGFKALKVFSTTWDPPSLASKAAQSTTVTVPGIAVGDVIIGCTLSSITDSGVSIIGAQVTTANTVGVTMYNDTGGSVNYGSGTLKLVWLDLT